jgi:hypothetical protein
MNFLLDHLRLLKFYFLVPEIFKINVLTVPIKHYLIFADATAITKEILKVTGFQKPLENF